MAESDAQLEDLKSQLQDKRLELEKEIALRKLLNSQKDEQAKKLRAAEQQIAQLSAAARESGVGTEAGSTEADSTEAGSTKVEAASRDRLLALFRESEERNEELMDKLHSTETELDMLKLSHMRAETAKSAKVAAQSAALMGRLSSMQRERETILTSQLRVALKERQEALARADAIQPNSDVSGDAEKTGFDQIFEGMRAAENAHTLRQVGDILVSKVRALRKEYDDNVRDKLQFLKSEKETAERKAQSLALDIARLQRRLEMTETEYKLVDKTRIKALQAQLEATVQERDKLRERSNKLEDTIETLKIVNSLQRSLRKEEEVKRSYELELRKYEAEQEALQHKIEEIIVERNMAIVERNRIAQERNELAVKAQQEFDRAEQLQRLVVVLRKKARNPLASSDILP